MVNVVPLYAVVSAILILIGLYAVMASRNIVKTILGIEVITVAVNLNILAFGFRGGVSDSLAQSMVFTSTAVGAAVAAVALSLIIHAYRHYGTLDLRKLRRLRW